MANETETPGDFMVRLQKENNDLKAKCNHQTMRIERLEGEREAWGDAFDKLAERLVDKIS